MTAPIAWVTEATVKKLRAEQKSDGYSLFCRLSPSPEKPRLRPSAKYAPLYLGDPNAETYAFRTVIDGAPLVTTSVSMAQAWVKSGFSVSRLVAGSPYTLQEVSS